MIEDLPERFECCFQARYPLLDEGHETALRLLNGFLEGCPDLVVDLYARTLLITHYAMDPAVGDRLAAAAEEFYLARFPFLQAVVVKARRAPQADLRRGVLTYGTRADRQIREEGVWYAVDLMLNQDASFYLDTRNLRRWALQNMAGKHVLNTFAYTGSLGVAAAAAGAARVVQTDLNRRFLNLAKDSLALNSLPVRRADFLAGDFWAQINQFKRAGALFDCVFVDPPFFAATQRGTVDLVSESQRVLNKIRPLVGHDGWLVVVNNALFLSGAEYLRLLQSLCADGYLTLETMVPVPLDCTGFAETRVKAPPADPAPFNHSTKIAIMRVRRKDQRQVS